ncbi:hypothetical protein BV898_12257 [Hypsibius exemplaris]|uniref:FAD-binding PCMH-type domain-containing protein n=1 Tax=Hypsibius exemplaris TaxID=2072580 RepID=A0A1W0WE84_HYPEX|nr:hypothetical protein BV898_12257 [Hypsibius exemplaris]
MENPDDTVYSQAQARLRASIDINMPGLTVSSEINGVLSRQLSAPMVVEFVRSLSQSGSDSDSGRSSEANPSDREDILHNWSGIKTIARNDQVHHPTTVTEIAELIKHAQSKVHVIGSGLSYESLMSLALDDDDAVLLSLTNFHGLVSTTDTTATFAAATTVDEVVQTLGKMDRMMPCSLGVIGIQTLAGAISTGTHGQGLLQSDYASIVKSLKVVLPNGDVQTVTADNTVLPLSAFVTSLGTLSVILEVEIQTKPRRIFYCRKLALPYSEFLQRYPEWNHAYEYVKVWWFPETSLCQVWLVEEATLSQAAEFLATDRSAPLKVSSLSDSMNVTVEKYLKAMSHDTKASSSSDQPQFKTVRRFAEATDLVGYHEQILCKGIPAPQVNCEIAVPFEKFQAATEALQRWSKLQPGRIHYPFIYRAAGKSSAWLSPANAGPVVWIGFLVYVAEDGSVRSDGMETMQKLQQILLDFDGLPHWGKHFMDSYFEFSELLPNFEQFLQLRRQLDPKNKLLSSFLKRIFL